VHEPSQLLTIRGEEEDGRRIRDPELVLQGVEGTPHRGYRRVLEHLETRAIGGLENPLAQAVAEVLRLLPPLARLGILGDGGRLERSRLGAEHDHQR